MQYLCLPNNCLLSAYITGKFEAPTEYWSHKRFELLEYELIIMTEGTLYLSYAGADYTVKAGEYLLLPPSNSFREGFKEAYCSFYWMHFTVELNGLPSILGLDPSLYPPKDSYISIPQTGKVPKPEKIIVLMKSLQDMKKNEYPQFAQDAMCTTIIMELYGQLSLQTSVDPTSFSQKQVYNDIVDYIKTNVYENIKVSDVAKKFGYNEKYLSHRFTEIAGIPLKHYITKQKMETANFLLSDTNETILEISKKLGFSDSHNFCRTYKSITGLTPSEYRNAYSKRLLFHY